MTEELSEKVQKPGDTDNHVSVKDWEIAPKPGTVDPAIHAQREPLVPFDQSKYFTGKPTVDLDNKPKSKDAKREEGKAEENRETPQAKHKPEPIGPEPGNEFKDKPQPELNQKVLDFMRDSVIGGSADFKELFNILSEYSQGKDGLALIEPAMQKFVDFMDGLGIHASWGYKQSDGLWLSPSGFESAREGAKEHGYKFTHTKKQGELNIKLGEHSIKFSSNGEITKDLGGNQWAAASADDIEKLGRLIKDKIRN